ncbi:DoxX family protein [Lentzea tibetensis]|uniref:DoxX family protein n=1 Tax=Lentzea tibetensis TaxID=2591470 RepID=A0A563EXR6_9PSEU|nr:DoxX family protein [Lentzea tibetensis]TWP52517.1 DoxX family protein [Lentzea tibetensis]
MSQTTATRPARSVTSSIARRVPGVARVLLGLLFLVTGLNGLLNFLPQPTEPMPDGALAFSIALAQTGYMLQLTSLAQAVAGALLVTKRYVPLALALLAPVVVNIFLFHVFLAPSGMVIAVVVSALEVYLAWTYRNSFRPMLRATA